MQQPATTRDNDTIENDRLRFALTAAGIGTWDLEPLTGKVIWDDRCRELFGFAPDEVVAYEQVLKYMNPADAMIVDEAVKKALDPTTEGLYEVRYRTIGAIDGKYRWVLSKGKAYFTEEGVAYRFAGTAQDITEAMHEREKARLSDKIAQIALENSNSGYFHVDLDTDNMEFSPGFARILTGDEKANLSRADFQRYYHPDDVPIRMAAHELAVQTGNLDYEARVVWQDGTIHWVRIKGTYIFDTHNKPYILSGTLYDTTAEHLHRKAVKEARDFMSAAFDSASVSMAFCDFKGNFLKVNDAYTKLLGYTAAELCSMSFYDVTHPDEREKNSVLYEELTSGERGHFNIVKRYIHKSGSVRWVHINVTRIPGAAGEDGRIMAVARDISAETEKEKALAESQAMFSNVTGSAPTGLWLSDQNGGLTYLNETLTNWTGMPYEKLLGTGWANAIIDEDRQRGAEAFMAAIATRTHYDVMFRIRKGDGSIIWCRAAGDPYYDAEGRYSGYAGFCMDIDELMTVTNELKAGETRFRELIEQAPVATCLFVGKDMKIEIANEIMLGYWGKGISAIGKPIAEALPELNEQAFPKLLEDVYTSGVAFSGKATEVWLEVDGVLGAYYFDFTYKPVRNAEGVVYGVMNMAVDVSAEVVARKQLEESELFSRSIIDNSPVAKVVFTGDDMAIKIINGKMLEMLGKDNSVIGMPFMDAVPELRTTPLMDRLKAVKATGETYTQPEERIELVKNGEVYAGYYNYIYKALHNTLGEIYGIIVTATEVTEQVLARKKIEEAENNLRGAVELAELGTWEIDLTTRILQYSERLRDWFGIGYDEVITVERAYAPINEEDRPKVKAAMLNAITPGSDGIYDVEYVVDETIVGKKRILHAQGKAFYDETGTAFKISGTVQDMTPQRMIQMALEKEVHERTEELQTVNEELVATNEELHESNEQLLHSNEELAQYAYVASHDLQEPLRKILMYSGMLKSQELSAESKPLVEKISQSSNRMSMLIRDLLEFSRLLKSETLLQSLNLSSVAEAVISDFELIIEEKNAVINIGELPVIEGVGLQMNQLFYNLINNALKFTKPDIPPVITIFAQPITAEQAKRYIQKPITNSTYYHISISDNGIGFDEKYSEQIFEIFKRLHGRSAYPGSGIGLALCRRIVANHNGHIYAESTPGMGTTFNILLPDRQYAYEINDRQTITPVS